MATIMHPIEYAHLFRCSYCSDSNLEWNGANVACRSCRRVFRFENGILRILDESLLDEETMRELRGNTFDLTEEYISHAANKDRWSDYYSHFAEQKIARLVTYLDRIDFSCLFSLGSGTGYEIKCILKKRKLQKVFASDLSCSALSVVPYTLKDAELKVGLFTSDLNECPIKDSNIPILVYEALHHTRDMHATLEGLMAKHYNNIFLVEPTTNLVIRLFAMKGWSQRREYSGVKPGRLDLRTLHNACRKYSYTASISTLWEFPEDYFRKFRRSSGLLETLFILSIDFLSTMTNILKFGNMSVVWLQKSR